MSNNVEIIIMINKMDRLILELKLPPEDAYLKLKHTLEEINNLIKEYSSLYPQYSDFKISPLLGNVLFSSGFYNFIFNLDSFSKLY